MAECLSAKPPELIPDSFVGKVGWQLLRYPVEISISGRRDIRIGIGSRRSYHSAFMRTLKDSIFGIFQGPHNPQARL